MSGKSFRRLIVALLLALAMAIAPLSSGSTSVVLAEGCSVTSSGCTGG